MATKIILPKQGLQMTEGTIIHWLVDEGDVIKIGQPLFEMETDKLTITIDSLVAGALLKIVHGAGETVPITTTIGIVGEPGEDFSELLTSASSVENAPAAIQAEKAAPQQSVATSTVPVPSTGFASPRAKMRAEELRVDISNLLGTAPDGMVIERDVFTASASLPKASPLARKLAAQAGVDLGAIEGSGPRGKIVKAEIPVRHAAEEVAERDIRPFTGMRKVIAKRMKQSQLENAQTTHRVRVRMTAATACRESLKQAGVKISFNDLVAFACTRALVEHPRINVELVGGSVWYKEFVNLGIAVALDEGLVVPVVRHADMMSLTRLSTAIKEMATGARDGALLPDAYSGGSFTISNLGMFGLDEFTAIINPPEPGILAVGKIAPTPVVVDGNVEVHPVMSLTLSYDHRVVDGAPAAQFLCAIKDYLENPYRML